MIADLRVQAFRAAVVEVLGHAPEFIEPGRLHRFGTGGRCGDAAGWCKLFADTWAGVFGCHRRGISETWRPSDHCELMTRQQRVDLARQVMAATIEREAQTRAHWASNAQRIAQVWQRCVPLKPNDPVVLYLKRRGFGDLWPLPQALRLHHGLSYWHDGKKLGSHPAMVAPVVAPDGRILALHRTYLTADGRKANVPSPKKLTGAAGPLAGAAIALHEPAHGVLGIAEGIETALAAWCASGVPTVAAYCAGNLAAWRWPRSLRRLVIFADADEAGRDAAGKLLTRAQAGGLRAEVLAPASDGSDWCDVWAATHSAEADA